MGELRKDYILDRWVLIAPTRGKRPHELEPRTQPTPNGTCPFCPGNEKLTEDEIGRVPEGKEWKIRWVPNKFPALGPGASCTPQTANGFFTWAENYGNHEVVIETPEHGRQLTEFSRAEIASVLRVWRERIDGIGSRSGIAYVNVFKNSGYEAGTSLVHSHSQVMAMNVVPTEINEAVAARNRFVACPHCKIVDIERQGARRCFENDAYVAFTPYASRFNYEVWVFPKAHSTSMGNIDELADIVQRVLVKINRMKWSYNISVHYAPHGTDLHFHVEICPRIAIWGGFEIGSGVTINGVSPEDAAAFYRGER